MATTTEIAALADLVRSNVQQVDKGTENSVDVGFISIKLALDSTLTAEQLVESIRAAEKGYFAEVTIERLNSGPSYIELGAWIGDQGLAMAFMGLGSLLGLWNVVTPEILGITDEAQSKEMMGLGFIMIGPRRDSLLAA